MRTSNSIITQKSRVLYVDDVLTRHVLFFEYVEPRLNRHARFDHSLGNAPRYQWPNGACFDDVPFPCYDARSLYTRAVSPYDAVAIDLVLGDFGGASGGWEVLESIRDHYNGKWRLPYLVLLSRWGEGRITEIANHHHRWPGRCEFVEFAETDEDPTNWSKIHDALWRGLFSEPPKPEHHLLVYFEGDIDPEDGYNDLPLTVVVCNANREPIGRDQMFRESSVKDVSTHLLQFLLRNRFRPFTVDQLVTQLVAETGNKSIGAKDVRSNLSMLKTRTGMAVQRTGQSTWVLAASVTTLPKSTRKN